MSANDDYKPTKLKMPDLPPNTVGYTISALMDAVSFLSALMRGHPEWDERCDELLTTVKKSVDNGETPPDIYFFLALLLDPERS